MKPEKTRHQMTDAERDNVLKLIVCGLPTDEISEIMHISKSSVSYIRQAHNACMKQDWSTLQKLSTVNHSAVDWAMRVTGTDKVFTETFGESSADAEKAPEPVVVDPAITREDFLSLQNTLQDIVYLLTEIRDTLK
jgi:hypothetical protein